MEIEQYRFIYEDLKQQVKEIPPLQNLLRLTEKSTKKLECLNLYSISDKREFDLELEQEQIMKQILHLSQQVNGLRSNSDEGLVSDTAAKIEEIKTKNMQIFDLLTRQDELLTKQIELVEYYFGSDDHNDNQIKIKEEDEFEDQYGNIKQSGGTISNEETSTQDRFTKLKLEIEQIGSKINKINNGRGKWYATDHIDFIKIYNKCGGNTQKLVEEGVKILGMKNTEIMDHLEIYQKYLQLEKEKKIVAEQYKQIKLYEQIEADERKQRQEKLALQSKKLKKQRESQENQRKRQEVMKYKQKKQEEKIKMLEEQERKEKEKIVRVPLPAAKKKQIIERNQKYISDKQNNFKKEIVSEQGENKGSVVVTKSSFSKGKQSKLTPESKSTSKNNEVQYKH